jgi:hypothetical protein
MKKQQVLLVLETISADLTCTGRVVRASHLGSVPDSLRPGASILAFQQQGWSVMAPPQHTGDPLLPYTWYLEKEVSLEGYCAHIGCSRRFRPGLLSDKRHPFCPEHAPPHYSRE